MGNFECNSIEDLVFSRSFRDWVLSGGSSEAAFWEAWIGRNPEKLEMVQHSKAIIYALQVNRRQLSEADIELEIESILQRLRSAPVIIPEEGRPDRRRVSGILPVRGRRIVLPGIAALALLVFLVGFILRYYRHPRPTDLYESFLADNKNAVLRQQTSEADSARNIDLPDGSRVRLSGGSRLYYAADLSAGRNRREVYLIGEAFFEIKKNVARPFYVLTPNLITKVLGTSFQVRAYPADTMDRVAVRTGKVSVFRKNDLDGVAAGGNESGGMVVTPNQVIVYDRLHNELNKLLAEQPEKLPEAKAGSFVFEATPISRVFRMLQDAYGIPMVYDEDLVSSCSLSATMGNESFYEKLNIICKAINASYEVIDGNIVITANGCK